MSKAPAASGFDGVDVRQRRVALGVIAVLLLAGAIATPFARDALFPLPGYMLAFGTTMIVTNLILASLLLSRGKAEDDGATALLGATYLFVGLIFLPMTGAFPGALIPGALIGTTFSAVWIWTIWHAGFGLGIVAYSACGPSTLPASPRAAFWTVIAAVTVVAFCATTGVERLPRVFGDPMKGMFTGPGEAIAWTLLAIDGLAVVATARRARESSERLWLVVAMTAACVDIWLTFKSGARFSVGWYLGKVGSLATTMVVLVALVNNVSSVYRKVRAANEALANLAKLDGLTGVANRRGFDESLQSESSRAARVAQPLALLMVDVDHFKLYNDRYGHQQGDECLRAVAAVLAASSKRPGDCVCRYGGEEFAVLLPATDQSGALLVADRVLSAISGLAIEHSSAPSGIVSVSIGVACGHGKDPAGLVRSADGALYAAKRGGRACAKAAEVWLPSESFAPPAEASDALALV